MKEKKTTVFLWEERIYRSTTSTGPRDNMGNPQRSCLTAIVDKEEATMDRVHQGWTCLMSAATPATCGAAMLIPESRAKLLP